MRPSISSMTASIIGWDAFRSARSLQVSSQCSTQGRRREGAVRSRDLGRERWERAATDMPCSSDALGPFLSGALSGRIRRTMFLRAACAALVALLLAPAAWARSPAIVSRAGEDPDVAVDAAGTGHFVWSRTIDDV